MTELAKLPTPKDALAVIEALEKKRSEEEYIKLWSATSKQAEIFEQFTSDIKIFGILGGNRSGKTEFGAFLAVAWALGKDYFRGEPTWAYVKNLPIPDKACNVWVVGLDFNVLKNVIWHEKLRSGRNHPGLVPSVKNLINKLSDADFQIFFANGSILTGKSADSGREKFQGASVDFVWIDEEPESDVYEECYQRTIDCGGKILLTLTPLHDMSSGVRTPWVFDLYEEMKAGDKSIKFVQLSMLDNPYVPKEEKDRAIAMWSGHVEEKARLYGEFVQRSGLVYNMWKPSVHMIEPYKIPRDRKRIVSIDPASTGYTAVLWASVEPNGDLIFYREYKERDLTIADHVKNILVRNCGDPIDIWLIDPKWGAQKLADSHKSGAQIYRDNSLPVRLAEVGEDYGMQISMEYMQATATTAGRGPKVYFFNDLHKFRDEIEHYTWAFYSKGELKGLSKEKPNKRNDHLMNAFQYLCALKPRAKNASLMSEDEKKEFSRLNSYT